MVAPRFTPAATTPPLMLDLCCGTKGASSAFSARGWTTVTVDIEPSFHPDIVADLSTWSWDGPTPNCIWASPPCTEFSRESMPWCRTGVPPNMDLVNAAKRIIEECKPTFWIIENVRGAVKYLGQPRQRVGPFYLWGDFPPIDSHVRAFKEKLSGSNQVGRAAVPRHMSEAVADAIESGLMLRGEIKW